MCTRRKPGPERGRSPFQQSKSSYPLARIVIDTLECPKSESCNCYIIVICDYFTIWVEAYPVSNHTALTVADKLITEFISRFAITFHSRGCLQSLFNSLLIFLLGVPWKFILTRVENLNRSFSQDFVNYYKLRRQELPHTDPNPIAL